ncbi:protein YIPF2 [Strix aluco]|uniref:protein YIPF2 n=1 Tax=Strix aluco TaxID=111821 RepID=UPI003DA649D2
MAAPEEPRFQGESRGGVAPPSPGVPLPPPTPGAGTPRRGGNGDTPGGTRARAPPHPCAGLGAGFTFPGNSRRRRSCCRTPRPPPRGEERPSQVTVTVSPEEGEPGDDTDTTEVREGNGCWGGSGATRLLDVRVLPGLLRRGHAPGPGEDQGFGGRRYRGKTLCVTVCATNPDLYGPFWVCATLVLALAGQREPRAPRREAGGPGYRYSPQIHKVTVAATLVYGYAGLVPLALWGFLRWRQSRGAGTYSFLETVCVYGYSLSAYIPTAVLWLIPAGWLQWLLLAAAASALGRSAGPHLLPLLRADSRATALAVVATVISLHALLAVGCKLYFFQRPPSAGPAPLALHTTVGAEGLRSRAPQPPGTNVSLQAPTLRGEGWG